MTGADGREATARALEAQDRDVAAVVERHVHAVRLAHKDGA